MEETFPSGRKVEIRFKPTTIFYKLKRKSRAETIKPEPIALTMQSTARSSIYNQQRFKISWQDSEAVELWESKNIT